MSVPFRTRPIPASPRLLIQSSPAPSVPCHTSPALPKPAFRVVSTTRLAIPASPKQSLPCPTIRYHARPATPVRAHPFLTDPCRAMPALPVRNSTFHSKRVPACLAPPVLTHPHLSCLNSSNSQLQIFLSFQKLGFTFLVLGNPNELI